MDLSFLWKLLARDTACPMGKFLQTQCLNRLSKTLSLRHFSTTHISNLSHFASGRLKVGRAEGLGLYALI